MCIGSRYSAFVIRSIVHRGLRTLFETGSARGVHAKHVDRLRLLLAAPNAASGPQDLNVASWRLHQLKGRLGGHWALKVDENWRVTFRFVDRDVELVDYLDYH
jgi:proteic killer suppression protein